MECLSVVFSVVPMRAISGSSEQNLELNLRVNFFRTGECDDYADDLEAALKLLIQWFLWFRSLAET